VEKALLKAHAKMLAGLGWFEKVLIGNSSECQTTTQPALDEHIYRSGVVSSRPPAGNANRWAAGDLM
jgi:hypothetical protein